MIRYNIELISTMSESEKIALKIRCDSKIYILNFRSFLRGIPPVNPDYQRIISDQIMLLEQEKHRSKVFLLPAILEKITDINEESITVRFSMPGLVSLGNVMEMNSSFTIKLNSHKQDINGALGLKIECSIKKL
jgi:hypothetical protein